LFVRTSLVPRQILLILNFSTNYSLPLLWQGASKYFVYTTQIISRTSMPSSLVYTKAYTFTLVYTSTFYSPCPVSQGFFFYTSFARVVLVSRPRPGGSRCGVGGGGKEQSSFNDFLVSLRGGGLVLVYNSYKTEKLEGRSSTEHCRAE
jgi:hypothetical protein